MAGLFGSITDAFGITNWGGQEEAMQRAAEYFQGIQIPEQKLLELERLVKVGELTPELAQNILQDSTAFSDVRTDPRLKEAQYEALMGLQERASEGLTAADRLQLAKIKQQEDTSARGAREAIIQQSAMQGRSGGGLEQLSKMLNQQESASRQSMRDAEVAAQSQEQKMAALLSAGQLGGSMRGQEYEEQSRIAQAKDYMDQFNIANQLNVQQQNVGAINKAREAELAERRKIEEQNTALKNQEILWGAQQPQQQFQNQVALASGMAGGQQGLAQMYGQQGSANLGMAAGIGAAVAASDIRVKKDIKESPLDIDNFLDEITGYKFRYKNPEKHGEGERLGVMTQDLGKSKLGSEAVVNLEGGVEGIDPTKALHAILASVGRLNERLNGLEGKSNE